MNDLLPLYFANECSSDTKKLVEEYFQEHPEFEQRSRQNTKIRLPILSLRCHTEEVRTLKIHRRWMKCIICHCFRHFLFTVPFSYYHSDNGSGFSSLNIHPSINLCTFAIVCWASISESSEDADRAIVVLMSVPRMVSLSNHYRNLIQSIVIFPIIRCPIQSDGTKRDKTFTVFICANDIYYCCLRSTNDKLIIIFIYEHYISLLFSFCTIFLLFFNVCPIHQTQYSIKNSNWEMQEIVLKAENVYKMLYRCYMLG